MKVVATIEKGLDGTFDIHTQDDRLTYMVLGQGDTIEEAQEDFFNTYNEIKELYAEEGKKFKEIKEFEFKYDTSSFLAYYNQYITLSGLGKLTGINKAQLSQYIQGYRNPSPATTQKIEKALHEFAQNLQSVRLY